MKLTINIFASKNAFRVAQDICRDAVLIRAGERDYTSTVASAHVEVEDLSNCTVTVTSDHFRTASALLEWMNIDRTLINPDSRTDEHVDFDGESYLSDMKQAANV